MKPNPVIHVQPLGRLGNRAIQYMVALKFAAYLDGAVLSNVIIEEWDLALPEIPPEPASDKIYTIHDGADIDFHAIIHEIKQGGINRIVIADYLQRMDFFLDRSAYADGFGSEQEDLPEFADDELVINLRTGEIVDGIQHYPLTPIAFYEELVESTGLKPVFLGQIDPCFYVEALKQRFPAARYIDGRGSAWDFEALKRAKNIVVATSTFSWLAAWISRATSIFLPMNGFFNPAHFRQTDLLPVRDPRFRFYLFPLNYGVPEIEAMAHHEKMRGHWREVTPAQVDVLRRQAPFAKVNFDRLPARFDRATFDAGWYIHNYIEAADEISAGWFDGPPEHYAAVGRLRGYAPHGPAAAPVSPVHRNIPLRNVAFGKWCTQSSISPFSIGSTCEEDARNAVNGQITGRAAFHTNVEKMPWWMVDLGEDHEIAEICVFNRMENGVVSWRATPLLIHLSSDRVAWKLVFRLNRWRIFGGIDGNPLVWQAPDETVARYVRLMIGQEAFLHLDEVQVFAKDVELICSRPKP